MTHCKEKPAGLTLDMEIHGEGALPASAKGGGKGGGGGAPGDDWQRAGGKGTRGGKGVGPPAGPPGLNGAGKQQYSCGNFSDTYSLKFLKTRGSTGQAFAGCVRTAN